MKRMWKRVLGFTTGAALLLTGAAGVTLARERRSHDAPYPQLSVSKDPKIIERGRYLASGPAHCADCHGDPSRRAELNQGLDVPLSGGFAFVLPVGTFHVPNITPDAETGIGRYSDQQLARILRYGVHADGHAALPFMPFADLSDEDLVALLSFLRAQAPVRHQVPKHEPNALGHVLLAFVLEPRGPSQPPRAHVQAGPTPQYGRYLANSVANCVGCHTKVDLRTGQFAGPRFGGGAEHESLSEPGQRFITPNLTPDPRWGWIASWSEDAFVQRLRAGRVYPGSPMPWQAYQRMSEDDLRAIYRYLKTLPAAQGGPDPKVREAVALSDAR